jgi:filamentous hemagglutinin family protein
MRDPAATTKARHHAPSARRIGMGVLLGGTSLLALTVQAAAQAVLPQGASVASGQVRIGTPSGNSLTINQSSSRAVVDWNSFSVGANASVHFVQPGAGSAILNRVTGTTSSTIAGQITANGQVFLVNPNGIAITPTGSVQVGGGFVASTLDISNADFNACNLNFSGRGASSVVTNAGTISAAPGSFVGLIGGSVASSGTINVPLGKVGLGAGEKVTLNPTGDGFLQVALPSSATTAKGQALIDVAGQIKAAGGSVEIKAATARQAVRDVVNISGTVSARSVSGRRGRIVLDGGDGGEVVVSGRIAADGGKAGKADKAGTIVVTGNKVTLASTAKVSANGAVGGTVLIGGDQHGGDNPASKLVAAPVRTAETTEIAQGATVSANGSSGDGGNVVVWSDSQTDFRGSISATGNNAGHGGAVEVSSHGVLGFAGTVDVTAAKGKTGTLLLDPYDVTISNGVDSNMSSSGNNFSPNGNSSVLSVATLQTALLTANVTVDTGSSGAQNGDITVANAVTWATGNSLTLNAAGAISINAAITATSGSLSLSGATISVNSTAITLGGSLTANATASGATTAVTLNNAAITVGGGVSTITGASATGIGVDFSGSSSLAAGGGASVVVNGSNTGSTTLAATNFEINAGLTTSGSVALNGNSTTFVGLLLNGSNNVTAQSGSLTLSGTAVSDAGLQLRGTQTLTNSGATTFAFNGTTSTYRGLELLGGVSTNVSVSGDASFSGTSNTGTGVIFGNSSAFTVTGGNVNVTGLSTSTSGTGATLGTRFATASVTNSGSGALTISGTSSDNGAANSGSAGVLFTGTDQLTNSGGGGLSVSGTNTSGYGLQLTNGTGLTTSGTVTMTGTSGAGYGVQQSFSSVTSTGALTLNGISTSLVGLLLNGGSTLTASSGNLTVNGTSSTSAGLQLRGTDTIANSGAGSLALNGSSNSSSGFDVFSGANLTFSGNTQVSGTSASGTGLSVSSTSSTSVSGGNLALSGGSASGLAMGLMTSSSISNNGTGTLALTASGDTDLRTTISSANGDLVLTENGTMTQSGGTITAGTMLLSGASGNFALNASGNSIGTLATNTASLSVTDGSALTIGTVAGTSGVTASSTATLVTSGNLTIASSAPVSAASPVLAAGGAFINNAGSSAVTATSGRWLVYSSAPGADTFGGLDSGNTAVWNATHGTVPPASVTAGGNRYLFAMQPTLTFTSTDATKTYGTDATTAIASHYGVTGYQSGVAGAFLGDNAVSTFTGAPSVTSPGAPPTASVTGSPYAINVGQASLAATSGYAFAFNNSGRLTVNPAPVTVTALGGSSTYGASSANPGLSATGLQNGDNVSALWGLSNSFGVNAFSNAGNYTARVGGTLLNPNYTLVGTNTGTWTVNPAPVSVTALSGSSLYGLWPSGPGFTATGLQNGQTIGALTGLFGSFGITGASRPGSYTTSVGGTLTNPNYTLVGTTFGTWSVSLLPGAVTALASPSTAIAPVVIPTQTSSATLGALSSATVNNAVASPTVTPGLSPSASPPASNASASSASRDASVKPASRDAGLNPTRPLPTPQLPTAPALSTPALSGHPLAASPAPLMTAPAPSGTSSGAAASAGRATGAGCGGQAGTTTGPASGAGSAAAAAEGCAPPSAASKIASRVVDFALNQLNREALAKAIEQEFVETVHGGATPHKVLMVSLAFTSIAFTAGLVGWLLRGGSLVAALLSSIPLWRGFDPLVIVTQSRRSEGRGGSEIDTMFDGARAAAAQPRGLPQ